jgi:hypothetical protein
MAFFGLGNLFGRACSDELSASRACLWAKVENPIGIFQDIEMVFDDEERSSLIHKAVEKANE